jgi:hypothetical protein
MSKCDPDRRNSGLPVPTHHEDPSSVLVYAANGNRIVPHRICVQIDPYTRLIVGFQILPPRQRKRWNLQ